MQPSRANDAIMSVLGLVITAAIAMAVGRWAWEWVVAVAALISLLIAWESWKPNFESFPAYWLPVIGPLVFLVAMMLAWFLKTHTIAVVITPPLW